MLMCAQDKYLKYYNISPGEKGFLCHVNYFVFGLNIRQESHITFGTFVSFNKYFAYFCL